MGDPGRGGTAAGHPGTATAAPMILPLSQSVLHIWSAIETLFPDVRMELKFRIALYVAQPDVGRGSAAEGV